GRLGTNGARADLPRRESEMPRIFLEEPGHEPPGTPIARTYPHMDAPRDARASTSMGRLGNELVALGLSGRDVRCLLLLPQVYVGWALEPRDVPALEALLDTTVQRAQLGPEQLDLARGWLFERPERRQFQSGFALLRALRRAPDQPTIDSSDLLEALLW